MRAAAILPALAILAACSGGAENSSDRAEVDRPDTSAAASPSPPAADILRGRVSSLSSAVNGLDIRVTDTGTIIDLPADALFEFDKAELTPEASSRLAAASDVIRGAPPGPIRVVGHTDSKGDDGYNQTLSEARARTVADWFGGQVGVRQRSFDVGGMGERAPVAANQTPDGKDDPAGRARNRRVEVIIPNR